MSYIRDERIESSLPAIRTSFRAWEAPSRSRITTVEDPEFVDERVKYGTNGYRESYYPRPPSPSARRHANGSDNVSQLHIATITNSDPVII